MTNTKINISTAIVICMVYMYEWARLKKVLNLVSLERPRQNLSKAGPMSFASLAKFTCTYEIRKSNSTWVDFGTWRNKDFHYCDKKEITVKLVTRFQIRSLFLL